MAIPQEALSDGSPEVAAETVQSVDELLRQHDEDVYGYVGQAAATLPRLSLGPDREKAFMAVADYASAVHDPALMQACLREMNLREQWQVFAHEVRDGNFTIDFTTIDRIAIEAVELESAPEETKDWISLVDIYVSQAEIILLTDGIGLETQLDRLEVALQREYAANGRKEYSDLDRTRINRRIVHALLRANLPDEAKRFEARLYPYYHDEYVESLPLYERYHAGKPLTPVTRNAMSVFQQLSPEEYVAAGVKHQFYAQYGAQSGDVRALLQAGRFGQAQSLYEGMLDYCFDFSGDRVRMALDMALYVPRGERNPSEDAIISEMEGVRSLAQVIVNEPTPDIMASAARITDLESAIESMCARIPRMPYSSQRIAIALELASIKNKMLPQSGEVQGSIDALLFNTWYVIAHTHGNSISTGNNAPGTRELWDRFKEVGFNLKKLQSMNRGFADYTHPKFRPRKTKVD